MAASFPSQSTNVAVLVGKRAPSFKATAVIDGKAEEAFSLGRYLGKKHVLFYF